MCIWRAVRLRIFLSAKVDSVARLQSMGELSLQGDAMRLTCWQSQMCLDAARYLLLKKASSGYICRLLIVEQLSLRRPNISTGSVSAEVAKINFVNYWAVLAMDYIS